jgi:hypothetical protein
VTRFVSISLGPWSHVLKALATSDGSLLQLRKCLSILIRVPPLTITHRVRKAIPRQNVLDLARLQVRAVSAKRKDKSPHIPKCNKRLIVPTHQAAECPKRKCRNCCQEVRSLSAKQVLCKISDIALQGHDALECKESMRRRPPFRIHVH